MPPDWQRTRRILEQAMQLEFHERQAFLASACGGDEAFRAEVESLLRHENVEGFLERPPRPEQGIAIGDCVGSYRLRSHLGRGGMGEVFLAVRTDDFEKQVAIKFLRADYYQFYHLILHQLLILHCNSIC